MGVSGVPRHDESRDGAGAKRGTRPVAFIAAMHFYRTYDICDSLILEFLRVLCALRGSAQRIFGSFPVAATSDYKSPTCRSTVAWSQ